MSDFNLLGFLNVNVPNDPPAPITFEKQNFKIVAPARKFKETSNSNENRNVVSSQGTTTTFTLNQTQTTTITTGNRKYSSSPFFKTTYHSAYGTATTSEANQKEERPTTPTSVTSVSSISSTISTCDDCLCDDCLNRQHTADKKAFAEAEKNLENIGVEIERKRLREVAERERAESEEKRIRDRLAFEEDMQRVRAEKAAARAQHQKEENDFAEMQRSLAREDTSALEAQRRRNHEHLNLLQIQIDENRARRAAELKESKIPYSSSIAVVDVEEARRRAQAEATKDLLKTLAQQIADRKADGVAEREAEKEDVRRRQAADDAAARRQLAVEEERNRRMKEDLIRGNRYVINERKAQQQAEAEAERAFARQEREANARKIEEENRRAEEKRRSDLEALHSHLVEQVQRKKEALERQREEDKAFIPHEAAAKKKLYVHCGNCERDLPPERFSNYVVTPNGKVYQRSKATQPNSPLHKYLYSSQKKTGAASYDFS